MYFPLGWPKYLSVGQGRKSKLKHVACNRYRMLFAVLTETTISIWHCKPCVEIVCYQRCHSSVVAVGNNDIAEWRQDSSMLAVSTTEGYLLLYQLEQDVKGDKGLNLYEYHQTKTNQDDANDAIPALRLTLTANVNYKVQITSLSCGRDDLLVTLQDGRLELVFWENPVEKQKSINLNEIMFSVDMQVTGSHLKSRSIYPVQAVYSSFLEGFAVVLSDGRAGLVALSKSETEAQSNDDDDEDVDDSYEETLTWNAKGIWAPGLNQATCVAINNKYRLLSFGTRRGDCCIYAIDDVTRSLVLSHTIALSHTHYPNICKSVGSVLQIDWSPDGCVLALSWAGGGLSVWSVFGACLVCTLATDRAYAYDGTLLTQGIYKSMCWGVEGYHLWLIGDLPSLSSSSSDLTENDPDDDEGALGDVSGSDAKSANHKGKRRSKKIRKNTSGSSKTSVSSDSTTLDQGQLLQLQFAKSALAMNPCMSNHFHVLLHGEDKIFLSCGEKQLKSSLLANSETLNSVRKAVSPSTSESARHSRTAHAVGSSPPPRRRSVPTSPTSLLGLSKSSYDKLTSINEDEIPEETEDIPSEAYGGTAVGNKQWTVIPFPLNYLPSNWPIRFTAVDETCSFLAIAGNFGLAHYTVLTRKWKVFGNVMQEKDMVVTGGLTWWEDFVVVACYNLSESQDEIRVYPRLTNLDNSFACRKKIRSQILLVNVFRNLLILFTYDCRISIFVISRDPKVQRPMAVLRSLQEISMARFVSYPTLVVSVTMSALHMENTSRRSTSSTYFSRPARETEVIIFNVAGRLLLLQRSLDEDENPGLDDSDPSLVGTDEEPKMMKFTSPVVLASCVENIWTTGHKNRLKVHLTDALWLGCGGAGVRVWLPLFPPRQTRQSSSEGNNPRGLELQLLTARRITLAFSLDSCYPLAVLFNEAVILGVTSETLFYQAMDHQRKSRPDAKLQNAFPYSTLERTCEIYLHQILRQLLRRNLGYHALQVAGTCKNLSCFPHVLELMLHEVLEEEATASEPIPDPLLPTVIKFLQEFPEYLQTVVHCARKTEIALWEYLFNSVGSPRDLFEECFKTNQLQTAASYLIILQNLEQLSVARQDATKLFDQALQSHMWELANDIARFLRAIGDGDASAVPRHPTLLNTNIYPAVSPAPLHANSSEPEAGFKFSDKERRKSALMRQYSMAPSYHEMALAPSSNAATVAKDGPAAHYSTARKLTSSRSCPSSPPAVISFSGYKARLSSTKSQGSCSSPTSDYPPSVSGGSSRRISTRSYTESFLLPAKTTSTASSNALPTSTVTSSISNSFVSRYSVRQYHQENPVHRPLQHSLSHPLGGGSHSRLKRLSSDKTATPLIKEHAASECAEHYFIDVILARQARKMLASKQLHKLGTFAAYVDFQLVPWLKKERNRAARIDDPISSLKALHADFDWPYPTLLLSKSTRASASSGESSIHSQSFNDLHSLHKNFNSLSISRPTNLTLSPGTRNSLGLKSLSNLSPKRSLADHESGFSTDEDPGSGILTVLTAKDRGSTLTLGTAASEMSEVMSETSYTFDDSYAVSTTEDIHGFLTSNVDLDDKRGPPRSEMKLQYLLELFLEALCIEWSLLISIMLKDSSYMARLLRTCRCSSERDCDGEEWVPLDTLQRTRDCLVQIDQWAVTECPGYKAVLINSRSYVQELYDVINAREVAHAEQQALKAKQQQRNGAAPGNINVFSRAPESFEQIHKTTKPPRVYNRPVFAKKQLFGPGAAVAQSSHNAELVNGMGYSSASDGEYEPIRRQGSLVSRKRPKTLRTRHNSVPCSPESVDCGPENTHIRTPSSPAKFNLTAKPSIPGQLAQDQMTKDGAENDSSPEQIIPAPYEVPNLENPPSGSAESTEDATSSSVSNDDEDSGCTVS